MICKHCDNELIKSKIGWLCALCGAVGPGKHGRAAAAPVEPAAEAAPAVVYTAGNIAPITATPSESTASLSPTPVSHSIVHPIAAPRWHHWVAWAAVILLLLAAITVFYVWPAYSAAHNFQAKLATIKTAAVSGQLQFYGQDFLAAYDSKLDFRGKFDARNTNPALALGFEGSWAKHPAAGEAIIRDSNLYFQLTGTPLPVIRYRQSAALLPLTSQWYRSHIDTSLYDNFCANDEPGIGHPLALYRLIKAAKITIGGPPNVWAHIGDQSVAHYQGQVKNADFEAMTKELESMLPRGCGLNTLGFTATDAKNIQLHYDLWTSPSFDRLRVIMEDKTLGSKFYLTLDGHNYNEPQTITPPVKFADLSVLEAVLAKQIGFHPPTND